MKLFKTCTKCNKKAAATSQNFHKNVQCKYNFSAQCKKCVSKYQKEKYIPKSPPLISIRHRKEVIALLKTTQMSCREIGEKFGVSYGPIGKIKRQENIIRFNVKIKNLDRNCKWCDKTFRHRGGKTRPNRGKFCCKQCYSEWQQSDSNRGVNHPNWKDGGKHESYLNGLRKTKQCGRLGERRSTVEISTVVNYATKRV